MNFMSYTNNEIRSLNDTNGRLIDDYVKTTQKRSNLEDMQPYIENIAMQMRKKFT